MLPLEDKRAEIIKEFRALARGGPDFPGPLQSGMNVLERTLYGLVRVRKYGFSSAFRILLI